MTRREDAERAFEDAHVVVEREAIYTLAAQKRGGEAITVGSVVRRSSRMIPAR
jgi:hypothetical protein